MKTLNQSLVSFRLILTKLASFKPILARKQKLRGNIIPEEEAGTGIKNAANSSSVDHITYYNMLQITLSHDHLSILGQGA